MVILIRHGEAENNINRIFDSNINSNKHLTDNGRNQIYKTFDKLHEYFLKTHMKVDRFYCSPLLRTIETAKIIKECFSKHKLYNDDRLCIDYSIREIGMGDYDGKSVDEYPDGDWNFISNDKYGGESIYDVHKRCSKFLKNLNPYNVNVVVTHGEPLRQMLNILINNKTIKPKKAQAFVIDWEMIIFNSD